MAKWLVGFALLWPLLLLMSVWQQAEGRTPAWVSVVYLAGAQVCHQRPERSFHTGGVQWPVCGRCAGLYLAAPLGAILAAAGFRRRWAAGQPVWWLAVAAAPTAATLGLEWLSLAHVTNLGRFLAALPLGAAIAFVVVRVATADGTRRPVEVRESNRVH